MTLILGEKTYTSKISEGSIYSIYMSSIVTVGGSYFFYLDNNEGSDLVIERISVVSSASTTLFLDQVSGIPSFTTAVDIVPINRNIGASSSWSSTIKSDTATTGLTNNGVLLMLYNPISILSKSDDDQKIIIPDGEKIALRTIAAATLGVLISVSKV